MSDRRKLDQPQLQTSEQMAAPLVAHWATDMARLAAVEAECAALRQIVTDMQEAFNRGALPAPRAYQSLFTVWPGANPASNNSG